MQTAARRTSLFAAVLAIVAMPSVGTGLEQARVQDLSNTESSNGAQSNAESSSNTEPAESQRSNARSSIELAGNQRTQKRNSQLLAEIRAQMRSPVVIEVDDMVMEEFPEYLSEVFSYPVSLDEAELLLAGFDPQTFRITASYSGVRGDTALRDLLYQFGCNYYIQGGLIVITTRERADIELVTVVYDCVDLLQAEIDFLKLMASDQSTGRSAVDNLLDVITATTGNPINNGNLRNDNRLFPTLSSPRHGDGWRHLETGPGTLKIFAGNLVVCQTLAVHEEIEDVLAQLRAAFDERQK